MFANYNDGLLNAQKTAAQREARAHRSARRREVSSTQHVSSCTKNLVPSRKNSVPPGKNSILRETFGCRWLSRQDRAEQDRVGAGRVGQAGRVPGGAALAVGGRAC